MNCIIGKMNVLKFLSVFCIVGFCRLLQNAVSKNATQFKGNAQHDAQEFLLWLLDRVHEDLNTVNPNTRPAIKVNCEVIRRIISCRTGL